ncbi:MAG: beta-ACP synthase [Paludibacteraceae bacterium]|nr:beta-ACP synthase [Paludibacteraceae bacterium]
MKRLAYWGPDYLISSMGMGLAEHQRAIEAGTTGLKPVHDPRISENPYWAGAIDWSRIPALEGATRLERLMVEAGRRVLSASSVAPASPRLGLVISSTKGNIDLLSSNAPLDERVLLGNLAKRVAGFLGLTTCPQVVSNACISGLSAIILAQRLIVSGAYDRVLVIGADLMTPFVQTGFCAFKSVSRNLCRPFDAARDGLSMGEACGAVLLTCDRAECQAPAVAVAGGAVSNDANHISGPSRTGDGLYLAMREAMREAGVTTADIDFVGLHGTATVYNDEMESKAVALAGLSDKPANSFKPYIGHTLGACGVIESVLMVAQLRNHRIWGTLGFEQLGTPQPLQVSASHRDLPHAQVCLKSASGFGGCNAAIVFALDRLSGTEPSWQPGEVQTLASVSLNCPSDRDFDSWIREAYKELDDANMKFFKMDNLCKLGYVAAEKLLKGRALPDDRYRIALVLSNRYSSLDTDSRHQALLDSGQPASPAVFVYTLANIVSGEISIRHKLQGEGWFLIETDGHPTDGRRLAQTLLHERRADLVLSGRCEMFGETAFVQMDLLSLQSK